MPPKTTPKAKTPRASAKSGARKTGAGATQRKSSPVESAVPKRGRAAPSTAPKTERALPKVAKVALPKKKGQWGGPRPGSGRKPGPHPRVRHRKRLEHDARYPLHLTLPRIDGLPSFRSSRLLKVVREAILDTGDAQLEGFRVVLFVIGPAEIDFLAEADDPSALTRGLRSLSVRLAMRVNGALERTGHVFGDRYRSWPQTTAPALNEVVDRVFARNRETAQPPRTALLKKICK